MAKVMYRLCGDDMSICMATPLNHSACRQVTACCRCMLQVHAQISVDARAAPPAASRRLAARGAAPRRRGTSPCSSCARGRNSNVRQATHVRPSSALSPRCLTRDYFVTEVVRSIIVARDLYLFAPHKRARTRRRTTSEFERKNRKKYGYNSNTSWHRRSSFSHSLCAVAL